MLKIQRMMVPRKCWDLVLLAEQQEEFRQWSAMAQFRKAFSLDLEDFDAVDWLQRAVEFVMVLGLVHVLV